MNVCYLIGFCKIKLYYCTRSGQDWLSLARLALLMLRLSLGVGDGRFFVFYSALKKSNQTQFARLRIVIFRQIVP